MREVYFDGKAKLHLQEYLSSRTDDNNALIVTSNYHVYRALRYCKKIKFKTTLLSPAISFNSANIELNSSSVFCVKR